MNVIHWFVGCLRHYVGAAILLALSLCVGVADAASEIVPPPETDPHYTKVGFFDIHVCNWPNRPLFFLTLFSTYDFNEVAKVEVFTPDGRPIGELDVDKYRVIEEQGKPEKRSFIKHFDIPGHARDGWYKAVATMKDGRRYAAEDFVVIRKLERAQNIRPVDGAENVPAPEQFTWNPIPGAKFYQVFVRDMWEDKLVFESPLLTEAKVVLPGGLLQAGGYYRWQVHARDVNENVLLGDFNHGSLSEYAFFSVASE